MTKQSPTFWEHNKWFIISLFLFALSISLLLLSGNETISEECHVTACHIDDKGEKVCTTKDISC